MLSGSRFLAWVRWQRVPVARIRILEARSETAALLFYAIAYIAFSALTALVIRAMPMPVLGAKSFTQDVWYSFAFKLVGLLILPLIWLRRRGYRLGDVFVAERPLPKTILLAGAAFMLGLLLNAGHMSGIMQVSARLPVATLAPRIAAAVLMPLFTAALPEEIVYRGLLQTRLEATTPAPIAILTSAVLFAAWHLPSRYLLASGVDGREGDVSSVVLGTGVPAFIIGLVFGVLWYRYRRLLPLITAHWGIDLLPALSSLLGINF